MTATTTIHQHIASDEAALRAESITFGGCVQPLTLDSASSKDELYQQRIAEIDKQVDANHQNVGYTPSRAWQGLMRT
jgi:hypothetical protein